jgi:hypothetical protein
MAFQQFGDGPGSGPIVSHNLSTTSSVTACSKILRAQSINLCPQMLERLNISLKQSCY